MQNPDSLIARIYGIFTVQMEDITPVHILLMSNAAQAGKLVEKVFDLKGSIINREVKESDIKDTATLKDVNLQKLTKDEVVLLFQPKDRLSIMEQIYVDIKFLQQH